MQSKSPYGGEGSKKKKKKMRNMTNTIDVGTRNNTVQFTSPSNPGDKSFSSGKSGDPLLRARRDRCK